MNALLPLAVLLACQDEIAPVADTACVPTEGVSWSGWGEGFFTTWCRSCHSATAADRRGAPADLDFDTPEDVWVFREAIARTVIDMQTMPVGGGLPDDEMDTLGLYLACPGDSEADAASTPDSKASTTTLEDVDALLGTALGVGPPRADVFWVAYLAVLAEHAQPDCPFGWQAPPFAFQAGMEGCTTGAGWTFSGLTMREEEIDGGGTRELLLGDAGVRDPAGAYGAMGGSIEWWVGAEEPRAWWQTLNGTWGFPWEDGWIGATPSLSITLEGTWVGAETTAVVDGGLTVADASVWLDAVSFDTAVCPTAPVSGGLEVRDAVGDWSTVVLAADCSGCGGVTGPSGVELGTVCPDWSAWMTGLGAAPQ